MNITKLLTLTQHALNITNIPNRYTFINSHNTNVFRPHWQAKPPVTSLTPRTNASVTRPSSPPSPVCEPGQTVHVCNKQLCEGQVCFSHPHAICRVNPCGGCSVQFVDEFNSPVNCEVGLSECQRELQRVLNSPAFTRPSSVLPSELCGYCFLVCVCIWCLLRHLTYFCFLAPCLLPFSFIVMYSNVSSVVILSHVNRLRFHIGKYSK